MTQLREFTGFENRPFTGTILFRLAAGGPMVLGGTYALNLYRAGEVTPFTSGTVAGGQLTITGAAGQIDFTIAAAAMSDVVGYGSAEVVDTSLGSRVLTTLPVRFLPQGTPWQTEYGETLVVYGNAAFVTMAADLSAGTAIVAPGSYSDIDVTGGGLVWTINGNVVTNGKLRTSGGLSVIGRSANSVGNVADITAANGSDAVLREQAGVLGFGTIATGGIANNAVTDAKLRTSASLSIIGRSANSVGNVADIAAANGSDAVLREQGGVLGFGTIATGGITNNAVTDAKLRTSASLSIVGRSVNSVGNVADIASSADGQYLGRRASALGWFQPTAAEIANTPAGGIAATNVQAALNELDTEKLDKAGGTVAGNLTVTGNFTLNGSTYRVDATTVTYDDIILVIGGDTAPVTDDAKDRGIEFRWHNGTTAKIGFFGWDRSTQEFVFIPDATDTADVLSGADGTFRGALNGNAATATKWATGRTISLTGMVTGASGVFDGSGNLSFAANLGSFTKAQLDAAVSDGDVSYVGHTHAAADITDFTEAAQDVIGALFVTGGEFTYSYNDAANTFAMALAAGSVANGKLANMAAHTIKANITGGAAAPVDSSLSAILDAEIGNTQGLFLVRKGAGWGAIGPGTAGQVPTSQGPGNDPIMAAGGGGGGGSPGGINGQIQFNNAGAFDGLTDQLLFNRFNGMTEDTAPDQIADFVLSWDNSASAAKKVKPQNLANAGLDFAHVAAPAAPAAGASRILGKTLAGKTWPAFRSSIDIDTLLQPMLARRSVAWWMPPGNATTVPGVLGMPALTAAGTATARTVATTNRLTRARRIGLVSAATAGALSGYRNATAQITTGDGTGIGGFTTIIRFGTSDAAAVAGARAFVGLSSSIAAPTNVDPATLTNCVGVAQISTDNTQWYLVYGGSAAQAAIALGAGLGAPTATDTVYELALTSPPEANGVIYYQVTNINTGATASGTLTPGTPGLQTPASTTLLTQQLWRTNNATALAVGIDVLSIYSEQNI